MPPLNYLIENILDYEGVDVYVDGLIYERTYDGTVTGFILSPDPVRMFGTIPVKAESRIPDGTSAVCVRGRLKGGILLADEVIMKSYSLHMEVLLNLMGLMTFIPLSLREWRITLRFPFIEFIENA